MRAVRAAENNKTARKKIFRIKVISMGDTGVGKSCLIKRYCEDKFVSKYIPTIGVDYGVKPIKLGEYEVRVNLWDLAGPDDYVEVRNEFYKDSQGCILVYDVTSRASFESMAKWMGESAQYGANEMVICVAGTKAEIPKRQVTEKEGREWASSKGFPFFEVSASSGTNVKALFTTLFARLLATIPGVPQELAAQAVQQANAEREDIVV